MGQSLASQDVVWAMGEAAEHVGFVARRALCGSELLANSKSKFWLLKHKEVGVHYSNAFWESSGDQNRPQEARSKVCSCHLSRNCSQNNPLPSFPVLVSFCFKSLIPMTVLFAEPQFSAHLFSRETRPPYRHLFRLLPLGNGQVLKNPHQGADSKGRQSKYECP